MLGTVNGCKCQNEKKLVTGLFINNYEENQTSVLVP